MTRSALAAVLLLATTTSTFAIGCKKHDVPSELVGSYTRSGGPPELRAELSVARGGMVLTVARLSASVDVGVFSSLFTSKNSVTTNGGAAVGASADLGRNVVSARTFHALSCEKTSCNFELNAENGRDACQGSFEKVQNTLIVVATGECQVYAGRWALLEALPPDAAARRPVPFDDPDHHRERAHDDARTRRRQADARLSARHSGAARSHVVSRVVLDRRHALSSHEQRRGSQRLLGLRGEGPDLPREVRAGVPLLRRLASLTHIPMC